MKRSKVLKRIGIVALSSVLAAGSLVAMTGCGGGDPATTITVKIYCNDSDKVVNEEIMNRWAKNYAEKEELGFDINIDFTPNTKKGQYFTDLKNDAKNGVEGLPDLMYLAPKYVKRYAKMGYVMDLTPYLEDDDFTALGGVWNNAVSYYGYDGTDSYTLGQPISYDASKKSFATASGSAVQLYGLPKDYSNFSLGFNRQYFSKELVEAYQTTLASTKRNVSNPTTRNNRFVDGVTPVANYTGGSKVATFAADGTYYIYDENGVPDLEHPKTAKAGDEAPMLCFGVPVTYTPFNFYLYNDFASALSAGDPIATLTNGLSSSRRSVGFTVTMPGLPGWTFKISDADGYSDTSSAAYKAAVNADASYDSSIGHTVLTYQEYGVLSWAMTYYLNTFAWEGGKPTEGNGGKTAQEGGNTVQYGIYGGEQYEYEQGCILYLLPWLAASDADFINEAATTGVNPQGVQNRTELDNKKDSKATEFAGKATEDRSKLNLDGTTRTAKVQYGINSEQFLKVYAAYANHGAIWNANAGSARDGKEDDGSTGWDYFRQGRSIFYGAGSWDAATRNDVDPDQFSFGQMPTPVAEEYALYSTTPNADYDAKTLVTYRNANNIKGTGDAVVTGDKAQDASSTLGTFTPATIYKNQILRQDKWAARMDSVGYAANGRLDDLSEDDPEAWKAKAVTSLIAALTISEEDQITLTYAGAQLPNFVQQCNEFLNYQNAEYKTTGAFKDMLTPDGFADNSKYGTDPDIGAKIWKHYMDIVVKMGDASHDSTQTVSEWLQAEGCKDYDGGEIRYNKDFADLRLSEFTGASQNNYFTAMKVFNMVNFTYADRDLNIRMQTGLNAVRDSTMYTPEDSWLNQLNGAVDNGFVLTYSSRMALTGDLRTALNEASDAAIGRTWAKANQSVAGHSQWMSPAMYATFKSTVCNDALQKLIKEYNS